MRLVLRGMWQQFRPQRRGETPEQYMARRYPHLTPPLPWTDGTD